MIKLVRRSLTERSEIDKEKHKAGAPFIFVEFNAWLYQGYDDARAALRRDYDSILLMSEAGFQEFKKKGKIPRSLELNVIDLRCLSANVSANKARHHRGQIPPNHSSLPKIARKISDGLAQQGKHLSQFPRLVSLS
jgi:hypothetical protein